MPTRGQRTYTRHTKPIKHKVVKDPCFAMSKDEMARYKELKDKGKIQVSDWPWRTKKRPYERGE